MAKKGGIADVAKGRSDTYRLSPRDLHVKDGWNCRDLATAEAQQEIYELAQSIAEIGVKQTLTVYWEDGKAFITDGHRRRIAALMALDEMNADPEMTVPVITEARNSTEAERVFSQIVRNSGKPFTPLEQGEVFNRLVDLGWTDADISRRAGVSRVHVANLRMLIAAPKTLTNLVRSGGVSSTLAITTLLKHKGNAKAAAVDLKAAVKTAKASGKTHATAKDMKKPAPKVSFKQMVTDIFARTHTSDNPAEGSVIAYFSEADFDAIFDETGLAERSYKEQQSRDFGPRVMVVDLQMQIHHRTDDAILASIDGEEKNAVWLPRSEIEFVVTKRPIYQVTMEEWLATDKGLV